MLRRATVEDLPQLLVLVAEYCEADAHLFDVERVRAAMLPLLTDDTHGQVWVQVGEGERTASLDGYVVTAWSWSLESGGRECLVDELYVRQRRHGHGRALVEHALDAARMSGCRVAFLETETDNDGARAFYATLGFEPEPSVWMSRSLA
jgi:ribosomal protein S18 acetylase RimI-like enzyme